MMLRIFPWLGMVSPASLKGDLAAALLSALLVLPQGIAFATLAGLPPQYGLFSAIVPCIVAALAGSSWHVVTGPTNANSLALFGMLSPLAVVGSQNYIELALAITLLVGALQLLTGLLRLGTLANFISPTALLGFTSGAALLIALHALNDALGLRIAATSSSAEYVSAMITAVLRADLYAMGGALLVAVLTVLSGAVCRRYKPSWPYMLVALAFGTAVASIIDRVTSMFNLILPVTQLQRLGEIPSIWPSFHIPAVPLDRYIELLPSALALTVVALAQSISIARAVAEKSGQRIDGNREFVGQGLANIAGGFFSSYVACGSLNRSLPTLEAGAKTPLAAVFSAAVLLLLMTSTGAVLKIIPLAAISGLLWLVAWQLFDIKKWRQLRQSNRSEFVVACITLLATVLLPLEVAIWIGSMLSLGLYLHRTAHPAMRTMGFDTTAKERPFVVIDHSVEVSTTASNQQLLPECPQLKLLRMEGSVYFGAAAHVSDELQRIRDLTLAEKPLQKHLLVMTKSMNSIDVTGSDLWRHELRTRRMMGGDLYFHRPRPAVLSQWQRDGFMAELGAGNVFRDKASAIGEIFNRLDRNICSNCRIRVFHECGELQN